MQTEYIYIAGRGHSGSTLLEMLLGGHSKIVAMGELEKLNLQFARKKEDGYKYSGHCSCGQRPNDCRIWRFVNERLKERVGVDLQESPFSWRVSDIGREEDLSWKAPNSFFAHHAIRWTRSLAYKGSVLARPAATWYRKRTENRLLVAKWIREVSHTSASVDASKDPLGLRDIYEVAPTTSKILFLTRDYRAVVWSEAKRNLTDESLISAARRWKKVNFRIIEQLERLPKDRWLHVRYEDLCAAPEDMLRQICDFVGLEFEESMLDMGAHEVHTIGGNKIRYQPISDIKEDLSWKSNFCAEQLNLVDRVVGTFPSILGYSHTDTE